MPVIPAVSATMYSALEMNDFLAMVDRLGVNAVEIPTEIAYRLGVKQMRRISRDRAVAYILADSLAVTAGNLQTTTEGLRRAIGFAHDVNANIVNLYCSTVGGAGLAETRDGFCRMIEEILPDAHVTITLENELNPGTGIFALFESWKWTCERLPEPFGLTLDLGNFVVSGSSVSPEDIDSLLPRISHLHLKDVMPLTEGLDRIHPAWKRWRGARGWFLGVPPGQGIVGYPRFVPVFMGYSGYCTLEPFREEEPLREGLEFLQSVGFLEAHR